MKTIILITTLLLLSNNLFSQGQKFDITNINDNSVEPLSAVKGIHFINTNTGFVSAVRDVIENGVHTKDWHYIFKTSNGGINWSKKWEAVYSKTFSENISISFVNQSTGYYVVNTSTNQVSIFKTTDGGESWPNANTHGGVGGGENLLRFIESGKGYLLKIGGNYIYKYNPSGTISFDQNIRIFDINIFTENSGNEVLYVAGHRYFSTHNTPFLAKSTDNGLNFTNILDDPNDPYGIEQIYKLSLVEENGNEVIKLSCKNGLLEYNKNSIQLVTTWNPPGAFDMLSFGDRNNGYYLSPTMHRRLYKTTDGGVNWEIDLNETGPFFAPRDFPTFGEVTYFTGFSSSTQARFYARKLLTNFATRIDNVSVSGVIQFPNQGTNVSTPSSPTYKRGGSGLYLGADPFINEGQSNEKIFYKWSDGYMNNVNPDFSFFYEGEIAANYKTRELSNVNNAISYASKTKSLKDENGVINRIHESIGGIFYSRSTNSGTTFSKEEIVNQDWNGHTGNGNKNSMLTNVTSLLGPNPVVDPERNVAVVWQRRENNKEVIKFAYRTTFQGSGEYYWNTNPDHFIEFDAPENFNACAHLFARLTSIPNPLPSLYYFTLIPHLRPNGSQTQIVVTGKAGFSFSDNVLDEGNISDLAVTRIEKGEYYMELHFAYKKSGQIIYQKAGYHISGSAIVQSILEGETNISTGDGVSQRYTPDISLRNGKPVIAYRGFKITQQVIHYADGGEGGGLGQDVLTLDRYPIIVKYKISDEIWVNAEHYNSLPYSTQENPNVEGSKDGNAHLINYSVNGNSFRQFAKIDGVSGYSPSPNTFVGTDAKLVRGSYTGTISSGSLLTLTPESNLYRVGRQNFTITNAQYANAYDNLAGVITLEDLDYLFTLGPIIAKNTIIGHDKEKVIESHITNPVEFNSSMISNTFSMSDGDTLILGAYGSFIPTANEFNLNPLRYTVNLVNNTTSEIHRELFTDTITATDSIEVEFFRGYIITDIENTTDSFYVQLVINPEDLNEGDYYLNGVYQGESEEGGLGDGFAGLTNYSRKIFFEGIGNSVPGFSNIPDQFSLTQNYPNPFNPETNISFSVPVEGLVKLKVFDITGREVVVLVNELKTPGSYNVSFNGSTLSSGVYFYRIEAGSFVETKRMILMK